MNSGTEWVLKGGKKLSFSKPIIMGILNVTPDSFSDAGKFSSFESAIAHAKKMLSEGADIIAIGGESNRHGSNTVDAKQELERILPVVKELVGLGAIVCVDTRKPDVAKSCLDAGAEMINDVSGFTDKRMIALAKKYNCACVVVHLANQPHGMQEAPVYEDVALEVRHFLTSRVKELHKNGVHNILIDPGIGFGKTLEHNIAVLSSLRSFSAIKAPLCIGVSRKSFLGKINGSEVHERLGSTIAANIIARQNGAAVFRVHDVLENKRALEVYETIACTGHSDKMIIEGLECSSNIGLHKDERAKRQKIYINLQMDIDMHSAAESKKIHETADYDAIVTEVRDIVEKTNYVLLETLCSDIAKRMKRRFSARNIKVRIGKDKVAKASHADFVGVEFFER